MTFIIAVDGPAGAGKGLLSHSLAAHYQLAYLDTGLLYRFLALQTVQLNIKSYDEEKLTLLASSIKFNDLKNPLLRQPEISNIASIIASLPKVRNALLFFQKKFASSPPVGFKGSILDGRDIGTVICPNATIKIYLQADVKLRAKRRFKELQTQGIKSIYDNILQDMIERDKRDSQRFQAPLQVAQDAYIIDSTCLSAQEVLDKAIDFIKMRR